MANSRALMLRNQIDDAGPAAGVAVGRDHALGLVDCVVDAAAQIERLAIDANLLLFGIDAGAQLVHDLPIDLDAAGGDQLLALAAAAKPGGGQHLLQSLARWMLTDRRGGQAAVFFVARQVYVRS